MVKKWISENIPAVFKVAMTWVYFIFTPQPGKKPKKEPMNPATGGHAMSNESGTWASFEKAEARALAVNADALGSIILPGYTGIDLDGCVVDGVISPQARRIMSRLDTYTEFSPSGTGIHLIIKGAVPKDRKFTALGVEIYSGQRFLTFTGHIVPGCCREIRDINTELNQLYDELVRQEDESKVVKTLLAKVKKSNDTGFQPLYEGKWEGAHPSQSEADLAFCSKLAFWTGKNEKQTDQIFRQSGLMRAKWDEKHFSDGRTYGQGVVAKAIETSTAKRSDSDDAVNNNDIAEQILKEHTLLLYADKFYAYLKGCYRPLYIEEIHRWIKKILKRKFSVSKVNNTLLALRTEAFKRPEDIKNVVYLNVKNGLFDVNTYQLIAHTPEVYSINQLNVNYDSLARCDVWRQVVERIFEGDTARINLLQEYFGYCLTRETDYEKAMYLIGEGSNGKTVVLYVLEQLIGKENCSSIPLEKFNDFHYLARLAGKIVNISIETNAKSEV